MKFNFECMLRENHPQHATGPLPLAFFFEAVEEVTVLATHLVSFKLSEPFAPFLSNLAYPTGLIVSPSAVREQGKDYGRHPFGTGPFRFAEWVNNAKVVLIPNDDHRDGPPGLRAVVFRPITDANTRVAEMLSGGLDLMLEVPPDNAAPFRDDPELRLHEQTGPHLWFLMLKTREGPFKDKRVRQAVNYAIDTQAITEDLLQRTAEVAAGPIPPAFACAHDPSLEPYPHNPDKARALLDEAEAAGAKLAFYVTEGGSGMLDPVPLGTAIQADLAKVGLDVRIETYEWNTYLGLVNKGLTGQADMAEMAWMTNDPDTLPYLALRTGASPRTAASTPTTTATGRSTSRSRTPDGPPTRPSGPASTGSWIGSSTTTSAGSSSSVRGRPSTARQATRTPGCCWTRSRYRASPHRKRTMPRASCPILFHPPSGCAFTGRCPLPDRRCRANRPPLFTDPDGHLVACFHAPAAEPA